MRVESSAPNPEPAPRVRLPRTAPWTDRLYVLLDGAPPGSCRTTLSGAGLVMHTAVAARVVQAGPAQLLFEGGMRLEGLFPAGLDLRGLGGLALRMELGQTLAGDLATELALADERGPCFWLYDGPSGQQRLRPALGPSWDVREGSPGSSRSVLAARR